MRVAVLHYNEHALYTSVLQQAEKTAPDFSFLFIVVPKVSALRLKWWYKVVLPKVLEQNKITLIINNTGTYIGKTKVIQLLLTDDISFFLRPELLGKSIRKKLLNDFEKNILCAKHIIVPTVIAEKCIAEKSPANQIRVSVIAPVPVLEEVLEFDQREKVKQEVAGGSEYFFFVEGNEQENNLLTVLKAFSKFKKWQLSSMKLVIGHQITDEEKSKLRLYKYKDDVIVADEVKKTDVLRAAYALIYLNPFENFAIHVLQAMHSGVAVIVNKSQSTEELAAEAALYTLNNEVDELSAHLIQVYKDEVYRSKMIVAGKEKAKEYAVNKSAESLAHLLHQLVQS